MKPARLATDLQAARRTNRRLADLERRQGTIGLPRARFSLPVAGQSFQGEIPPGGGATFSVAVTGGYRNGYRRLDLSQTELDDGLAHWVSDPDTFEHHAVIDESGWYRCCAHAALTLSTADHVAYQPPALYLESGIWVQFTYPGESFEDEFANEVATQQQTRTDQIHSWATGNRGITTALVGVMYLEAGQKVWFGLSLGTSGSSADFFVTGGPPVADDNFSYSLRDPFGMAYLDLQLVE